MLQLTYTRNVEEERKASSMANGHVLSLDYDVLEEVLGAKAFGYLNECMQVFQGLDALCDVDMTERFVVRIPAKFADDFASGKVQFMRSKDGAEMYADLVDNKGANNICGKATVEKEVLDKANLDQLAQCIHNLAMQKQLNAILEIAKETYKEVKKIEVGQMDDRIALIDAGREEIMQALYLKDERLRNEALANAREHIVLGKNQIAKQIQREMKDFPHIGKNMFKRSFDAVFGKFNQFENLEARVSRMQLLFNMYNDAVRMLAGTFVLQNEKEVALKVFEEAKSFVGNLDYSAIKTIEYIHKGENLDDWFFNNEVEMVEMHEELVEHVGLVEALEINFTGEQLLEVTRNG